jgi:hypothetical protein
MDTTDEPSTCTAAQLSGAWTGPNCDREIVCRGLCWSHYQQMLRHQATGKPLTPLRGRHGQLGGSPLVPVSTGVSAECALELDLIAVQHEPRSATVRLVLESWALRQKKAREG